MKHQPTEDTITERRALLETEWHFQACVEKFAREHMQPVKCYTCPMCDEKHNDYSAAAECCPRTPDEDRCYECPTCSKLYDDAAEAYLCCDENQVELPPDAGLGYQIEHIELERRGQTRLFN